MKKGTTVKILDYYYDKKYVGLKGTVTRIIHDKDCIYAQSKWAEVKLDNGSLVIPTVFIIESEEQ